MENRVKFKKVTSTKEYSSDLISTVGLHVNIDNVELRNFIRNIYKLYHSNLDLKYLNTYEFNSVHEVVDLFENESAIDLIGIETYFYTDFVNILSETLECSLYVNRPIPLYIDIKGMNRIKKRNNKLYDLLLEFFFWSTNYIVPSEYITDLIAPKYINDFFKDLEDVRRIGADLKKRIKSIKGVLRKPLIDAFNAIMNSAINYNFFANCSYEDDSIIADEINNAFEEDGYEVPENISFDTVESINEDFDKTMEILDNLLTTIENYGRKKINKDN